MKVIFGFILACAALFLGYLLVSTDGSNSEDQGNFPGNVAIIDGQQIVELTAKAGYTPRVSKVQSGVPTILRFNTQGTLDCSSSVRIPSLNISQTLPLSGVTDISVGMLEPGTLNGSCGMGMYPFELRVI